MRDTEGCSFTGGNGRLLLKTKKISLLEHLFREIELGTVVSLCSSGKRTAFCIWSSPKTDDFWNNHSVHAEVSAEKERMIYKKGK